MLKKMKIRPSCKSLDGFFITLAIVSVLMLLYSTFYTYRATAEKNVKEQEIESFFDDCDAIKSASDLFTNEAKLFVIDSDLSHLNTYWEEAEKTQSVENAINHIKESGKFTKAELIPLEALYEKLIAIRETESKSMILIASANGIDDRALPVYLKDYELSDSQKRLSKEDKIYEARILLYGDVYKSAKEEIETDLSLFIDNVDVKYQTEKRRSTAMLHASVTIQSAGLLLVAIISVMLFFAYRIFCRNPLLKNANKADVSGDIELEEKGFSELCIISERYNENMKKLYGEKEKISETEEIKEEVSEEKSEETKEEISEEKTEEIKEEIREETIEIIEEITEDPDDEEVREDNLIREKKKEKV